MKNPVEATAKSLASGKNVYNRYCAECHGVTGNGVSEKAKTLAEAGEPKPSDLTDDKWDHGSTDGEIFIVIRDGISADMEGYKDKLTEKQIWQVINYIRSIGPKEPSKDNR